MGSRHEILEKRFFVTRQEVAVLEKQIFMIHNRFYFYDLSLYIMLKF